MSGRRSCFIILHNGQLSLDDKFAPTYTGGKTRPMQVPSTYTLDEMKNQIVKILKVDNSKYTVNIVGRFRAENEFIASPVEDDEACQVLLYLALEEVMIIYVEVVAIPAVNVGDDTVLSPLNDIVTPSLPEAAQGDGRSIGQSHVRFERNEGAYNIVHLSTQIGTSSRSREYQYTEYGGNESEGYETMSSGSSEDDYEELEVEGGTTNPITTDKYKVVHEIIHDYCSRTNENDGEMHASNNYREIPRSTQQWNAERTSDTDNACHLLNEEHVIPNELVEGMCFTRKCDLQFSVQGWSILNNVEYVVLASNKTVFTIVCLQHNNQSSECCHWRLHARRSKRLGGIWKISTIGQQHSCTNPILLAGHRQCNSQFISYFLLPTIRKQLDLKPREIIGRIEAKFNIKISYMKAWDARRKAIKSVFGSWEESYRTVNLFMESIVSVMSGSVYNIQSSDSHRFQRMFWAFGPCISGWNCCRPVLSLDGTFLLGKFRGTLLVSVGLDANNGLFPLAFAIVESECVDSWCWFLRTLNVLIPTVGRRTDLCIISDRHAGIIRGCREVFPNAAHRHCLRHLRENYKKYIRQLGLSDVEFLCQKMYIAGNTDDLFLFNQCMVDIINIKSELYQWLLERDVTKWALTHDAGYRYGVMTTNASESFNGVLKRARGLPIQALVTAIYYNIVNLFVRRSQIINASENSDDCYLTSKIQAKLAKLLVEAS